MLGDLAQRFKAPDHKTAGRPERGQRQVIWYPRGALGLPTPPPPLPPPWPVCPCSGGWGLIASQIGAAAGLAARLGTTTKGVPSHLAATTASLRRGGCCTTSGCGVCSSFPHFCFTLHNGRTSTIQVKKKRGHQTPWVWEAQEHNACEAGSLLVLLLSSARSSLLGTCTAAYA